MRVKSILTLLVAAAGVVVAAAYAARHRQNRVRILTQSELIFMYGEKEDRLNTDEDLTRIVIAEGKAYWIEEGVILVAPADENDEIDFDSAEVYNAIEAPRSELTKIMLILDNLKEDT